MSRPLVDAEVREPSSPIRTRLDWTLALALVLLLPFGVVAAVYAVRSARARDGGDAGAAAVASQVARRWIIAAIACGGALIVLLGLGLGLLGAGA